MAAPIWSALADRFAALSTEQEFGFNTYRIGDPTPVVPGAEPYRHSFVYMFKGTPSAATRSGVVTANGPIQRGEFARLNRFRWLSWAAGKLLGADPTTPADLKWYRHVHDGRKREGTSTDLTTTAALVQESAEAASKLAEAGPRPPATTPGRKVNNWPSIQSQFRVLRERFNSPQWHTARPEVAIVAFPDGHAADLWFKTNVEWMPRPTEPRPWCSLGSVWGEQEAVTAFTALANDAGTALPLELMFIPSLFPAMNYLSNMNPAACRSWLEFLYIVRPTAFTLHSDTPAAGSRVARLNSSPFLVSINAIDELLAADSPTFLRRFREGAIRFSPWLREEDGTAGLAAIEATSNRETATSALGSRRSVQWTDFLEMVQQFGDLLSILETLDRHRDFGFECFPEHPELAAYAVALDGANYRFVPRRDHMPGLERLLTLFDQAHLPELTLRTLQEIQGRVARALKIDRAAVNSMSFVQIAEALDATAPPTQTVVPPGEASRQECQVRTLGELLAYVRSVERAAASTRAEADAMNGALGSGYLYIQAAVFEATAEHKKHPAFPVLEAFTNAHYGPATYENLIRVRGAVCQARRCGTDEADRVLLEEAIQILGCPGATPLAPQTPDPVPVVASQPTGPYTLNDIRDLLHYRQMRAEYLAGLRSVKPGEVSAARLGISPIHHINTILKLYEPQAPRMTEDEAVVQPVYHWLVGEARADKVGLDEDFLRLLVGRVAMTTKRTVPVLMGLPLDEFDQARSSIPREGTLPATNAAEPRREGGNLSTDTATHTAAPQDAAKFVFATAGDVYVLSGFGETGHLPGSLLGLWVISKLVCTPGVPVPWAELEPGILHDGARTLQPTFDEEGEERVRTSIRRLRDEIENAGDEVERADSQRRLDELVSHLSSVVGLRGQSRDLNNPISKLRPKIWGRVQTVFEKLRQATPSMPKMARHFKDCITSTTEGFLYDPPDPVPNWETVQMRK